MEQRIDMLEREVVAIRPALAEVKAAYWATKADVTVLEARMDGLATKAEVAGLDARVNGLANSISGHATKADVASIDARLNELATKSELYRQDANSKPGCFQVRIGKASIPNARKNTN